MELLDLLRRAVATAVPSLAAVLVAPVLGAAPQAVAFGSVIVTQLAQTWQAGRRRGHLGGPMLAALGGSGGVLLLALGLPPLRRFLALPAPTPAAFGLAAATAPAAIALAGGPG